MLSVSKEERNKKLILREDYHACENGTDGGAAQVRNVLGAEIPDALAWFAKGMPTARERLIRFGLAVRVRGCLGMKAFVWRLLTILTEIPYEAAPGVDVQVERFEWIRRKSRIESAKANLYNVSCNKLKLELRTDQIVGDRLICTNICVESR